ncbi:SpoIID/LytB domain-containing protein [Nocardioides sp. LML1-1-1.1]|uniref:SpoIID/LytB domain-containing protein n=1 Tax=Nocardioides sp. LML1-1-1.1 TaxID=3135248 RepID=UPI00343CB1A8
MRALSRTLVTVLAAVLGLVVAPVAVESSPATAATSFPLSGRGWGHGHGMSQYGAQGAATRGLTYRQIVNFYYPGTKVGTAGGAIRVLLTKETRDVLVVGAQSGLSVRATGSTTSYPLARTGATHWMIAPTPDNATSRVWVAVKGTWTLVRQIKGQAEFVAPTLRLYTPSGSALYRGTLRSSVTGAHRDVVNVVPLEYYVRGVIAREMPSLWHAQALRAQAVAARSYAAFERGSRTGARYDVDDTTRSQVYGGVAAETTQTNAAVTATRTEVRSYGGQPAFTQFSSSNGGWTTQGSRPYLVARADLYDPVRTWTDTVTSAELEKAWPSLGTATRLQVVKRDGHGAGGGRVVTIRVIGTKRTIDVAGDTFRSYLGLKSTFFFLT